MKPAIDNEGSSPHLDEGSSIRAKQESARPSSPDLSSQPREARIDQKIREAEALLADSPSNFVRSSRP